MHTWYVYFIYLSTRNKHLCLFDLCSPSSRVAIKNTTSSIAPSVPPRFNAPGNTGVCLSSDLDFPAQCKLILLYVPIDSWHQVAGLDAFVTSVSWFSSSGKQASEVFAAACSDGSVRLITRAGREEKKVSNPLRTLTLKGRDPNQGQGVPGADLCTTVRDCSIIP